MAAVAQRSAGNAALSPGCALPVPQLAKRVLEDFPSPSHTLTEGGHTPGEGADFLLGEVAETVTRVRTEQGLLTYLSCLKALGGAPHLKSLKAITRLRLQSELYSLTSPGAHRGGWVWGGGARVQGGWVRLRGWGWGGLGVGWGQHASEGMHRMCHGCVHICGSSSPQSQP
jgi:hypothetical protein